MANSFSHLTFGALTDVGVKRKNNQDSIVMIPDHGVYCVADGMGGAQGGEVASQAAVTCLARAFESLSSPLAAATVDAKARIIDKALNQSSKWIKQRSDRKGTAGAGTTVVALAFDARDPGRAITLHAGDSRAYRLRDGKLEQLSKDHTVAAAAGLEDDSKLPSMFKGVVTRAVGVKSRVELEQTPVEVKPGDIYLLSSDGLDKLVPDPDIEEFLVEGGQGDLNELAKKMVDVTNSRGGVDNVSVMLVRVGVAEPVPEGEILPEELGEVATGEFPMADTVASTAGLAMIDGDKAVGNIADEFDFEFEDGDLVGGSPDGEERSTDDSRAGFPGLAPKKKSAGIGEWLTDNTLKITLGAVVLLLLMVSVKFWKVVNQEKREVPLFEEGMRDFDDVDVRPGSKGKGGGPSGLPKEDTRDADQILAEIEREMSGGDDPGADEPEDEPDSTAGEAERLEQERVAAAEAEQARLMLEKRAEEARLLAERRAEEGRIAREKADAERLAAEKVAAERLAREKAEKERIAAAKAEAARLAAERADTDQAASVAAEEERRAAEAEAARLAAAKAEQERIAKEQAEAARLAAEKAEQERIAKEKAEAERVVAAKKAEVELLAAEKAEAERVAAAKKTEEERLAREKAEAERLAVAKAEQERIAKEKAEAERVAAAKKAEEERLAREKAEAGRLAAEKAEQERIAKEKAEAERVAAAKKAEEERLAREEAEAERLAAEKAEQERIAKEKAEAERVAAAKKAEEERLAREKAEAERLAAEKAEQERIAKEKAEAERVAAAKKAEEERLAREKAEAERLAAEKAEQERIAKEKAEAERVAAAKKAEEERLAREKAEAARLAKEKAERAQAAAKKLAAAKEGFASKIGATMAAGNWGELETYVSRVGEHVDRLVADSGREAEYRSWLKTWKAAGNDPTVLQARLNGVHRAVASACEEAGLPGPKPVPTLGGDAVADQYCAAWYEQQQALAAPVRNFVSVTSRQLGLFQSKPEATLEALYRMAGYQDAAGAKALAKNLASTGKALEDIERWVKALPEGPIPAKKLSDAPLKGLEGIESSMDEIFAGTYQVAFDLPQQLIVWRNWEDDTIAPLLNDVEDYQYDLVLDRTEFEPEETSVWRQKGNHANFGALLRSLNKVWPLLRAKTEAAQR